MEHIDMGEKGSFNHFNGLIFNGKKINDHQENEVS
jgi:hypothetical protein